MGCINCDWCKHNGTEVCDDCSTNNGECYCHINPPCGTCVESKYEDKER